MNKSDKHKTEQANEYITKARMAVGEISGQMPDEVRIAVSRAEMHLKEAQDDLKLAVLHNSAASGIAAGRGGVSQFTAHLIAPFMVWGIGLVMCLFGHEHGPLVTWVSWAVIAILLALVRANPRSGDK